MKYKANKLWLIDYASSESTGQTAQRGQSAYEWYTYSHSPKMRIRRMAKGKDSALFNNTIEISFRDPDLVDCFAMSITWRRVSC